MAYGGGNSVSADFMPSSMNSLTGKLKVKFLPNLNDQFQEKIDEQKY